MTSQVLETPLIFDKAVQSLGGKSSEKPSPSELIEALLQAEKTAKKTQEAHTFEELIGSWRLCFITGTQKARNRAGIVLGVGRYLPSWIKIYLIYSGSLGEIGTIENLVEVGICQLSISGLAKFLPKKNMLIFDFTRMKIALFGLKIYDGYIRGGKAREDEFSQKSVSKQAFFTYFFIREQIIAARGREGGLAIWGKM